MEEKEEVKIKEDKKNKSSKEIIYGEFWQMTPKEITIHHEGLVEFIREKGFCWIIINRKKHFVQIRGKVVSEADMGDVIKCIYDYIKSDKVPEKLEYDFTKKDLVNLFVKGIDYYINTYKLKFLPIKEITFQKDTKTESFFYMQNGLVKVTADKIELLGYIALTDHIWKHQIKKRKFTLSVENEAAGCFEQFVFNLCNKDTKRFEALKSILGYTCHRYISPSQTYIINLVDEHALFSNDDNAEGGTGKSLLTQCFSEIRSVTAMDGRLLKTDSQFAFQQCNLETEILAIDDVNKYFVYDSFFSAVTGGLEIQQKYKATFRIGKEQALKIFTSSNYLPRVSPGFSGERRLIVFEVPSYYGAHRSPKSEFGHEFFQDWDNVEYNKMIDFLLRCTQFYLKNGIVTPPASNLELSRMINFVGRDLKEYLDHTFLDHDKVSYIKKDLYDDFIKSYPGQSKYYPSPHRFTGQLHKYLNHYKVQYHETPKSTKLVLKVLDWGMMPATETDEPDAEVSHKTISDVNTNYSLVDE